MDERAEFNLKLAEERLIVSKKLLDDEHYMDSVNRSYYAIFYSARALVANDKMDFSKHSAVMSYFRQHYVKTGLFDKKFSDFIGDAFDLRNDGDYTYFVNIEKDDAAITLSNFTKQLKITWRTLKMTNKNLSAGSRDLLFFVDISRHKIKFAE